MRAISIPQRGWGRGTACMQCRRTLKIGDCALVQKWQGLDFWWHRRCIEELLRSAPLDQNDYVQQFDDLREAAMRGEDILA